jgi:hypothetical protein
LQQGATEPNRSLPGSVYSVSRFNPMSFQDLGVAGLAVLGVRGACVPLPRSLLLYDAKKLPHLQVYSE